jgi:hypothetical protein
MILMLLLFTLDHLNIFKLEHLQADVILLDMDHPHRDVIESCVSNFDLPLYSLLKTLTKTPSNKRLMQASLPILLMVSIQVVYIPFWIFRLSNIKSIKNLNVI